MWVGDGVATNIRLIIMIDRGCVRVIPLKIGLRGLSRYEVFSVLESRHRIRMHTGLRAVFLSQLDLALQAIILTSAASTPIKTALSSDCECRRVS